MHATYKYIVKHMLDTHIHYYLERVFQCSVMLNYVYLLLILSCNTDTIGAHYKIHL